MLLLRYPGEGKLCQAIPTIVRSIPGIPGEGNRWKFLMKDLCNALWWTVDMGTSLTNDRQCWEESIILTWCARQYMNQHPALQELQSCLQANPT